MHVQSGTDRRFFDLFYIGEGETMYRRLLDLYKEYQASDMTRAQFYMKQAGFPAFTARSFMRQAIKRMARSQPLHRFTMMYRLRSIKRS